MLPILQIGPLALQLPGLLLLLGLWVGTLMAERAAKFHQLSSAAVSNMIFYALIGGILGARLGYVLRFFDLYLQSPLGILALNPNTLSPLEGVVAALLVAIVFAQRKGLPLWETLDVLTPGFASFMIFMGLAHLASGDAFGAESSLPWAIELWGARRHPTQIYEILTGVLVLAIMLQLSKKTRFEGFIFLGYVALASASRFLIEAFRGDSQIVFAVVRSAQIVSLLLLVGALIVLHFRASRSFENKTGLLIQDNLT